MPVLEQSVAEFMERWKQHATIATVYPQPEGSPLLEARVGGRVIYLFDRVGPYVARHGEERLHSVVFAAAVPPFLLRTEDNPDGPLTQEAAAEMRAGLEKDREAFFDGFTTSFFSVDGELKVTEEQRRAAVEVCLQSDQEAALACMEAFGTTDFRDDLRSVTVPTLVIHGDADAIVPLEGSGRRTHEIVKDSELVVLQGAPHGCNVSHAEEFNQALLSFLRADA